MSEKHYIGETGTQILVDCQQSLATATFYSLLVLKPDGSQATWIPTLYTDTLGKMNYLQYLTLPTDFSVSGMYAIQPFVKLPGWSGPGETVTFYVYGPFDAD
jgi:hypothetical protein